VAVDPYALGGLGALLAQAPGDAAPSPGEIVAAMLARPWWHTVAACRTADRRLFFPESGANAREAREICAGCPVVDECLAWALSQEDEIFGIFGGTSHRERQQMLRGARAAA
jgi:WhiB family transcriptional regulator, redox-sensing transcriptional regulator